MRKIKVSTIKFFKHTLLILSISILNLNCDKSESNTSDSFTITVSAFSESNGYYVATGNELIFQTSGDCQTWSRTAQADVHSSSTHLHYNAASNVSYNSTDTIFNWTEFGPELDQASIDATCAAGLNGKIKTVSASTYYQDKPNVYLKITKVEKN